MSDRFTQAVALHEGGRLDEASAIYREVLAQTPTHADALHLLGVARHQQGDHSQACELIEQAIAKNPRNAAYYANLGLVFRAQGRRQEAIRSLQQALAIDPKYQNAQKNLNVVLGEAGRGAEAIGPLRKALENSPQDATLWKQLGVALLGQKGFAEAVEALSRAAQFRPEDPDVYAHLGIAYKEAGRLIDAEAAYRTALRLKPDFPAVLNNLGIVQLEQGARETAVATFREALARKSDFLDAQHNLAVALRDCGQWEEAADRMQAVIARDGSNHEAHNNLGVTLQFLGRYDEALAAYDRAIRLVPDFVWGRYNRSQVLLLKERWKDGWLEHEWRFRRPGLAIKPGLPPRWDGLLRPEATLLVTAEQGLGDSLQFARFLPLARERVKGVVFECQPALVPLLRRLGLADQVVARGESLPKCDLHVPIMSLPGLLEIPGEKLATAVPYLHPEPRLVERWRTRLAAIPGRKIGIAWQGNPAYARDRMRSIPLAALAPLAALPDTHLVVLQKGTGREQLAGTEGWPLLDWTAEMDNEKGAFMDTAAIMTSLDLVVTSDTAIVHLAGGLGVPVSAALAHSPDWRWGIEGECNPWYTTLRVFRQKTAGDWAGVFERIRQSAAEVLQSF